MAILLALTSLCLGYYCLFVLRSAFYWKKLTCSTEPLSLQPLISVVIPARNEADQIEACLRTVCEQNYPTEAFEVILVNDHSTDATATIARSLQHTYANLKVLNLPAGERNAYKKAALTYGIAQAKGELIFQTDADCLVDKGWLLVMSRQLNAQTGLVAGPVYLTYEKHWLQQLQSLEMMGLIGLAGGNIAGKTPNMCNGANLAYRKAVFEAVGGFEGVDQVASGDDEFLLHKVHQSDWEIEYCVCPEAIVRTPAQTNWSALKAQRLRWVSKARSYQNRWVNVVQAGSYLGFWAFPLWIIATTWYPYAWVGILSSLLAKCIVDYLLMRPMTEFFRDQRLLRYFPLLQVLYIPYVLWIGLVGNFVRRYQWKDRSVR